MKKLILVALTLAALTSKADVFADYQKAGTEALVLAQTPNVNADDVVTKINEVVTLGYQIMDLYVVKYTDCVEQFEQLKSVDAQIPTLTYEQIDELYHDGKGLIVAPKVCYKGRSLVVHPYQVAALAKAGRLQSDADAVDHELTEVIERAGKFKKDLGL